MRPFTDADLARRRAAAAEAEARLNDLLEHAERAADRGLTVNRAAIVEARRVAEAARAAAGGVPQ